jgi:hypothetical protein
MSKAKTLAGTVSTGGPLADGEIGVSDVTGLQTALDGKAPGTAASASVGGDVKLYEGSDNGTNFVALKAPNSLAGNVTWTLPTADGTNLQVLSTNGSGALSWATGGGGGTPAGSNTQVQFNNSGAFGASSALTFSGTQLSVGNGTEGTVYFNGSSFGLIKSLSDLYYDGNTQIFRTAAGAESMRLVSSGALVLKGGNATPGGAGITFPATQSASSDANTLDDYEEGTWTPSLLFGGASSGMTYSVRIGTYTKVGNLVTATSYIELSAKGSSTGAATISGLPFSGVSGQLSSGSVYVQAITFADYPTVVQNSTELYWRLREVTNAGVHTDLTNADFANNSILTITVQYRAG